MEQFERRLPVYLLLDCGQHMRGESLDALQQGLASLVRELRLDPQALETANLSVITFADAAREAVPLTPITQFQVPPLRVEGNGAALGEALKMLETNIRRDVRRPTPQRKGDWKPLVFIITCGAPTDAEAFDKAVQNLDSLDAASIIACGSGPAVDTSLLKRITPNVLLLSSPSPGDLAEFIKWVSSSLELSPSASGPDAESFVSGNLHSPGDGQTPTGAPQSRTDTARTPETAFHPPFQLDKRDSVNEYDMRTKPRLSQTVSDQPSGSPSAGAANRQTADSASERARRQLLKKENSMSGFARRLPVYLLLDCSGSMHGEPIEAVKQGVKSLLSELRGDPQALETAYLSVITFDSSARQVSPLTELMQFQEPTIQAGGATALGEALEVLRDSIKREVHKTTKEQKGDWKPLVFILTDGMPTDTKVFDRAVQNIDDMGAATIVACGAGSGVDTSLLKRITPNVLLLNSASPGDLAEFFKWVSGSIAMSSASLDAKPGAAISLPPVPSNVITFVP